mgnify:CR=1 FL=1
MTGTDAEIVCGEWQTGDTAPTLSGERYNIVLDIYKIVRHPNYIVNIEDWIVAFLKVVEPLYYFFFLAKLQLTRKTKKKG